MQELSQTLSIQVQKFEHRVSVSDRVFFYDEPSGLDFRGEESGFHGFTSKQDTK
jgi:hypothetical protein